MPHNISAEPLAQMVRSITLQKRTGILQVEQLAGRGAECGEIYFENGSLVRAHTEHETGKAALQRISEWKQITCNFQSRSRVPNPLASGTSVLAAQPRQEKARAAGDLAGTRGVPQPEKSFPGGEKITYELKPRPVAVAGPVRPVPTTGPVSQPLVLRGTKLEVYHPEPVVSSPPSVQRWTTHLAPVPETEPIVRKVPLTPLEPQQPRLPSPEAAARPVPLPGRQAIFKVRQKVPVAQAIQQMERQERLVFILLDGQRTICDIARLIHHAEAEVESILVDLTRRGYTYYAGS